MTYDVCALGELLIDFTTHGISRQGNPLLEANPGGAPCNVLAMLAKLGHRTAFIGKVGNDRFGTQLRQALSDIGIDTVGLATDQDVHTTLSIVQNGTDGARMFSFYRNPGADMMLSETDINPTWIENAKIFHFGSNSMTHDCCAEATQKAVAIAKCAGRLVSFDPNLRINLWDSPAHAKEMIQYGLSQCDILKISDDELLWLMDETDLERAVARLQRAYPILLVLLTMGEHGSRVFLHDGGNCEMAAKPVQAIETTGAGDTFMGCALHFCLEKGNLNFSQAELWEMLRFANAAAAIVTTRKGAMKAMPTREEIRQMLAN